MTAKRINPVRGIPILPTLPEHLAYTQGNIYHVMPNSGSDSNDGLSIDRPLKTIVQAHTLATANQNDIVLLYAESNSAATTFDLQSSAVTWSKSMVHLIGMNSGVGAEQRAGIRFVSTFAAVGPLFTLSANSCYIANLYFLVGVSDTTPIGCVAVSGERNRFHNCHIAGMGYAANVIANAYSLALQGPCNVFTDCHIGYEEQRGASATTCEILTSGTNTGKNEFHNCVIFCGNGGSATNHAMVRIGATASYLYTLFDHCKFINGGVNAGGLNMTYCFVVNANPGGTILLDYCSSAGITDWSNDCGFIWGQIFSTTADGGIGAVLVK